MDQRITERACGDVISRDEHHAGNAARLAAQKE
jgi:hypothetical protein